MNDICIALRNFAIAHEDDSVRSFAPIVAAQIALAQQNPGNALIRGVLARSVAHFGAVASLASQERG